MQKTDEIQRFENTLVVKNQLIKMELDEIVDVYKEKDLETYKAFLATIVWMLNNEQAFFCIDEFITEKVCAVIDVYKDKVKDTDLYGFINELKIYLNDVDAADIERKKSVVNQYYMYHKTIRNAKFDGSQGFLNTLGLDAFVYFYLRGEDELPELEDRDELLLFSISYFIDACPSFFIDKNVYNNTINELDNLKKNTSLFDVSIRTLLSRDKKMVKSIYRGE
jgi:hypothetical protein